MLDMAYILSGTHQTMLQRLGIGKTSPTVLSSVDQIYADRAKLDKLVGEHKQDSTNNDERDKTGNMHIKQEETR